MELHLSNKQISKKTKPDRLLGYNYICTSYKNSYCTMKLIKKGKNNEEYLIKQFKKDYIRKYDKRKEYQTEVAILSMLKGFDLIMSIQFPYNNKSSIDILYDHFPLVHNLGDYFDREKVFSLTLSKFYFASFMHLFEFFKSKNILFRNFDFRNVYLHPVTGYIKLINLDSCKIVKEKEFCYTLLGKEKYLTPEMINYIGYSYSSNYFLLGVILYEMLHGYNPFEDEDPMITYQNILKGECKEFKTDRDVKLLLKQLMTTDIRKRLGAGKRGINEITSHKCFINFNWKEFTSREMIAPYIPEELNYTYEEYYAREYQNSPEMSNYLFMRDKPWKEQEVINNKGDKKVDENELLEEQLKEEYFSFMKYYEDYP